MKFYDINITVEVESADEAQEILDNILDLGIVCGAKVSYPGHECKRRWTATVKLCEHE